MDPTDEIETNVVRLVLTMQLDGSVDSELTNATAACLKDRL
jgi:hypothetical protein